MVFGDLVFDALFPLRLLPASVMLASLLGEVDWVDGIGLTEEDCTQKNAKLLQD